MKKTILLMALMAGMGFQAYGIPHQIADNTERYIQKGSTYNGSFDLLSALTNPAYDPVTEQITSATATFKLIDLLGNNELVTVNLGGEFFATAQNFVSVSLGGSPGNVNLSLFSNNTLNYSIVSDPSSLVGTLLYLTQLDFETGARTIDNGTPGTRVPDGGTTMALLGFGLVGMGCIRRRLVA